MNDLFLIYQDGELPLPPHRNPHIYNLIVSAFPDEPFSFQDDFCNGICPHSNWGDFGLLSDASDYLREAIFLSCFYVGRNIADCFEWFFCNLQPRNFGHFCILSDDKNRHSVSYNTLLHNVYYCIRYGYMSFSLKSSQLYVIRAIKQKSPVHRSRIVGAFCSWSQVDRRLRRRPGPQGLKSLSVPPVIA